MKKLNSNTLGNFGRVRLRISWGGELVKDECLCLGKVGGVVSARESSAHA